MNAERLLQHYEQIADAPDAVARLRRFILDLAVRGKLVRQDPADEPASDTLNRVLEEHKRRWANLNPKTSKVYPALPHEEGRYSIPRNWAWASALEVCERIEAGSTPPASEMFEQRGDVPFIKVYNLTFDGSLDFSVRPTFVSKHTHDGKLARSKILPNDVLMNIVGPPLGKVSVVPDTYPEWNTNQAVVLFRCLPELSPRYLATCLRSEEVLGWIMALAQQTVGQVNISVVKSRRLPVPLPPLAEQHRIVAKVDELMALCDELEAARTEREAKRDRLAAASLARLNTPDQETFRDDARFALEALAALTARPDQIRQLRQTILNLAVRGKLVAQDPAEEPAEELMVKVAQEISEYGKANRVARTQVDAISDEDVPFSVPNGWRWARLSELFNVITDGDHQPPPKADKGVAFLTIGNVTTGRLDFTGCRLVSEEYFNGLAPYRTPAKGDILYTVVGATYGRPALVESDRAFCVQRHIAILKPVKILNLQFLVSLLASPLVYDQATRSTTGTAQPTIALRPLRNFLVPLPPLAEQHRIVAKADELMALCDQLEASLTSADETRKKLLDALLTEALAPTHSVALREAAE